jgi:hypothetical protein
MNFSRQIAQNAQNRNSFFVLQSGKVAYFREDFTTDFTDNTDGRVVSPRRPDASARRPCLESVKSVKSVVQFFLVAAGRAGLLAPLRGYFMVFHPPDSCVNETR